MNLDMVDRNSFERCALSGPQKHRTKESDGFHNHSTQLTMLHEPGYVDSNSAPEEFARLDEVSELE